MPRNSNFALFPVLSTGLETLQIPFVKLSIVFRIAFDLLSFAFLIFMDELVSVVDNGWR